MTSDLRTLSLHLAECTELEAESFRGAVALLPCGALEGHGPHLPVAAGILIARAAAERAAAKLDEEDWSSVVLPTTTYSTAGALRLAPETAIAVVRDVCLATRRWGMGGVVLCSVTREPEHVACLREAARLATQAGVETAFPDISHNPYAALLGLDARAPSRRGGRLETALMMAVRPSEIRARMMTSDAAAATVEEGRLLLASLVGIFANAAIDLLEGGRTRRGLASAAP